MKPICVPCQRFFRPKKNGFRFIEGMPENSDISPGKLNADQWKPYKLWEGCGAVIVVGVGREPIDEHYTPTFERSVAFYKPELQVNDC